MSENGKQDVDTNSAEFNEGLEAGLNSAEDTKNWKSGNELGQELKDEAERESVSDDPSPEPSVPLFMEYNPPAQKENLQDEKDETEE